MLQDILKAFNSLIDEQLEKAVKKGDKKVGNPAYRKTLNEKGKVVYVLVNGNEHPSAPQSLTKEEFVDKRGAGDAEQHFDKAPVVRSMSDIQHLGFLSSSTIELIDRCLSRVKFYQKSIALAKAMGNTKTAEGHQIGMDREFKSIDTAVSRDFNRQYITESINEDVLSELRGQGVEINIPSINRESVYDFINQNFPNFNFSQLTHGMQKAIQEQKSKLEKKGIPTTYWKPQISMTFHQGGFVIGMTNSVGDQEDNAKYRADLNVKMSREFSIENGKKKAYHAYFVLGENTTTDSSVNPLRGGFAKSIMQNFYQQYVNDGIEKLGVSAAGNFGDPDCGANTWGRWGFTVDKSTWNSLLSSYKRKFSDNGVIEMVNEKVIEHKSQDDIFEWKKNQNGSYSRISYVAGDSQDKSGRKKKIAIKTKKTSDDTYRSKVRTYIQIKQSDVEEAQKVIEDWQKENPNEERINLVELFKKMDNSVVKGMMKSVSWRGEVDLTNEQQHLDFKNNVLKQYERLPISQLEEKHSELSKLGKESKNIVLPKADDKV